MSLFVLELMHVRNILAGLKCLREKEGIDEKERESILVTLCTVKSQMVGKLKTLDPFMRNAKWLTEEIIYERNPTAQEFHDCENLLPAGDDGKQTQRCGKPCRGKMCGDCWELVLQEVHGTKNHQCKVVQGQPKV